MMMIRTALAAAVILNLVAAAVHGQSSSGTGTGRGTGAGTGGSYYGSGSGTGTGSSSGTGYGSSSGHRGTRAGTGSSIGTGSGTGSSASTLRGVPFTTPASEGWSIPGVDAVTGWWNGLSRTDKYIAIGLVVGAAAGLVVAPGMIASGLLASGASSYATSAWFCALVGSVTGWLAARNAPPEAAAEGVALLEVESATVAR